MGSSHTPPTLPTADVPARSNSLPVSPDRPKQVSNQTLESQPPPRLAATPNHLESPFILFQKEELPYFSLPRNLERVQI